MNKKIKTQKLVYIVCILILFLFAGCDVHQPVQGSVSLNIPIVYGNGNQDTLNLEDIFDKEAYSKEKSVSIQKILDIPSNQLLAVYTKEGEIIHTDTSRCIIHKNRQVTVNGKKINDIIGLLVDPPTASVMDTAKLAEKYLKENKSTLIIFLDGFSWNNYEKAKKDGLIPNISQFENIQKATSVYPPITPVGYASMVSGETPFVNGIKDRRVHILNCDTIFDKAKTMGKKSCVIEGDGLAIELNTEVFLNPDSNEDGLSDDEAHDCAIKKLEDKYDLMLIHLHGIDDTSHSYGPESIETYIRIAEIDKMVADFLKLWEGNVIIVADHGMHSVSEKGRKGNHGNFCAEDLFIPLITGEVGRK